MANLTERESTAVTAEQQTWYFSFHDLAISIGYNGNTLGDALDMIVVADSVTILGAPCGSGKPPQFRCRFHITLVNRKEEITLFV